jgi:predicted nucleic acid-binding protein
MAQIVLTDATPLVYLSQIKDGLSWLKRLFGTVCMTHAVRSEVTKRGKPGAAEIDAALRRRDLRELTEEWSEPNFPWLHEGEASTISVAINLARSGHTCLVLMDEKAGRDEIGRLGSAAIAVSGTAAVVGRAKEVGLISSAAEVFGELREKGFYISEDIVRGVLKSVGEGGVTVDPLKLRH